MPNPIHASTAWRTMPLQLKLGLAPAGFGRTSPSTSEEELARNEYVTGCRGLQKPPEVHNPQSGVNGGTRPKVHRKDGPPVIISQVPMHVGKGFEPTEHVPPWEDDVEFGAMSKLPNSETGQGAVGNPEVGEVILGHSLYVHGERSCFLRNHGRNGRVTY